MSKKDLLRMGVIAGTISLLLLVACGKKKTPLTSPTTPAVTTPEPTNDIAPAPSMDRDDDPVPIERPQNLDALEEDARKRGLLGDVFFGYNRYELRAEARERLSRNAEFFSSPEGRGLTFTIEGHCDERGTNEYNIALGQRRTTTALDYLVSLGVDRGRFKTISYGEERPFCTESSEGCWQQNRRARFVVSGRN